MDRRNVPDAAFDYQSEPPANQSSVPNRLTLLSAIFRNINGGNAHPDNPVGRPTRKTEVMPAQDRAQPLAEVFRADDGTVSSIDFSTPINGEWSGFVAFFDVMPVTRTAPRGSESRRPSRLWSEHEPVREQR
jgi:hypothetical protein